MAASPSNRRASHGGDSKQLPPVEKRMSQGSLSATNLDITQVAPTAGHSRASVSPVKIPWHLSTQSLTRHQKLSKSTGNLHGYMAEDYSSQNWPLPKMFGPEKYGYSLIGIYDDPRYLEECADMSRKLIRLNYDEQLIDLEWRKTYKSLLDAEHRQKTLPANCKETTREILKKEVNTLLKYLHDLQEQRDMYKNSSKEVYDRCAFLKRSIKKERDLEHLRQMMSKRQQEKISEDNPFWRTKFQAKSQQPKRGDEFGFGLQLTG